MDFDLTVPREAGVTSPCADSTLAFEENEPSYTKLWCSTLHSDVCLDTVGQCDKYTSRFFFNLSLLHSWLFLRSYRMQLIS